MLPDIARGLGDVIKLRILRGRDYPGLLESAQCHPKSPYRRKVGGCGKDEDDPEKVRPANNIHIKGILDVSFHESAKNKNVGH